MGLLVWIFECARCHKYFFACMRCLGNQRYCPPCGEQMNRESVREAGRRYQQTPNGSKMHALRQRRLRVSQKAAQAIGQASVTSTPSDNPNSAVVEAEDAVEQTASPVVTHGFVRELSEPDVTMCRTPVAAYVTRISGEEGCPYEPRESGSSMAHDDDASRTCSSLAYHSGRAVQEAMLMSRQDMAAVLAQLRQGVPAGAPIMVACSRCGRMGELVLFDGQPRIVRGEAYCRGPP